MHRARPAGSFLPDLSRTPMIWSLTSALDMRVSSFLLGRRSGRALTTGGKARRVPTIVVASFLGTPFSSEVEMMQLAANKQANVSKAFIRFTFSLASLSWDH